MKNLAENFKKIYKEDRGFLGLVFLLFFIGLIIFIFMVVKIGGGGSLTYVGYGDIGKFTGGEISSLWSSGGYRSGSWGDMLAFPALVVIFGIVHGLLSVQIFTRRGKEIAKVFILLSILLIFGALTVFLRLLGEG